MGVEDFHRLTNALQMNHVLSFNLKAPINRYHRADLTGIPVMGVTMDVRHFSITLKEK